MIAFTPKYGCALIHCLLKLAVVASSAMLASCHGPIHSYRVRATATIETDKGQISASSVYQIYAARTYFHIDDPSPVESYLQGEAIRFRVRQRNMFIGLSSVSGVSNLDSFITRELSTDSPTKGGNQSVIAFSSSAQLGRTAVLPLGEIPAVIIFSDPRNPNSSKIYAADDPLLLQDLGIIIKEYRITIVDEKPSYKNDPFLPWLPYVRAHRDDLHDNFVKFIPAAVIHLRNPLGPP